MLAATLPVVLFIQRSVPKPPPKSHWDWVDILETTATYKIGNMMSIDDQPINSSFAFTLGIERNQIVQMYIINIEVAVIISFSSTFHGPHTPPIALVRLSASLAVKIQSH